MSGAAPCQVVKKFQTGVIAPVQVLYDQQNGLFDCLRRNEVSQNLEAAAFLLFGIERRQRGRSGAIWKYVAEFRKQREKSLGKLLHLSRRQGKGATGEEGAQEVQERSIGDGVIGRKATALQ